VKEALVLVSKDAAGDDRLVAYLVGDGSSVSVAALRQHVQSRLPQHMVPAAYCWLEKFPLTPNGKVNRKALPEPEVEAEPVEAALADPLQMRLAEVWEKVLGTKGVNSSSNFFDCGGHSLSAVRLLTEVENVFGAALPLATIFQAPTLAE